MPISATPGSDGVTFRNLNLTPDSRFVIVGLADQQPTGFTSDTGEKRMSPNGTQLFVVYQVTRRFFYRNNRLGECTPTSECPPPPPCPPSFCPPWRVAQVSELKPGTREP
jgi:hypothetical protein